MANHDSIQTFTGKQFFFLDPDPSTIDIRDIAHALSNLCRFGGHVDRFYSVAQHCCLGAGTTHREVARAFLLHDACEAYLIDIPRPIKKHLKGYEEIENRLQRAIEIRFGLRKDVFQNTLVTLIDERMLFTERRDLMKVPAAEWASSAEPFALTVVPWEPKLAEAHYLAAYHALFS